jgi:protein pelota
LDQEKQKKDLQIFFKKYKIQVVEGIDSGGEDGIYTFTKSQAMKEIMSESKLAKVSSIIDEIMIMANKQSRKFTMGFEETFKANQFGAVESLVFSDKIIQTNDEKQIIDFLNDAESKGVKTYGVDSSTDIGLRVTGLGGIVSLLRFPVES